MTDVIVYCYLQFAGLHISPEKSNIYLAGVNNDEAVGLIEVSNMQIESKKAPIAWSKFYDPKSYGGWNLVNMNLWNKAAMLKLLWAIAYKSDRLWVKWVHEYYIKRFTYTTGVQQHVPWKRLIYNNHASPKSKFIVWLAIQNRLATTDRLLKWNVSCRATCSLYDREDESVEHLFFACAYAASIWRRVCLIICVTSSGSTFDQECAIAIAKARGSTRQAKIYTMCFSETIYAVWGQRNNKIFNGKCLDCSQVVKVIIFRVACLCKEDDRHLLVY
ncbi:uncharacterized protein LOC125498803 [Beta vulgaris subsp. vulgaris]|uniref:uncharacterized protein LOC125498803 n=1 Tax=Beta vulgaris subsp. vulgaris TaxID=3555 RepID=UPI00203708ED|nr:uncharacterized protein LOC125498803 [Beta vulgaris subsp. vulgaris]